MGRDLLAAKERDLEPLREESAHVLELDYDQTEVMEDFLDLAWFSGTRSGRDQMNARATQRNPDVKALAISNLQTEFKGLMHESADSLNLTVIGTITMWNYLHEAWLAGTRTCETEMMAIYLETQHDVGEEASKWLQERGERESPGD